MNAEQVTEYAARNGMNLETDAHLLIARYDVELEAEYEGEPRKLLRQAKRELRAAVKGARR